ncbi:hypothetical protein F5144DRAFT_542835 [Chaetomium tenue]|uniref:Uncharacterized protein n=1 Tax=Chaetomium tenue TaxID=1854479 RepID=A0ACB7PN24_9PEZI|nr:hypothetical protein F5144DRAFT_542835 [Chaetomium globosum]
MPSTRCLYLFALVALFAVATQLPTRLIELLAAAGDVTPCFSRFRNVGYLPSLVDELLRDEGLRSCLQEEYIKLRDEYRKQQSVLASLNHDITKVCKEHNNHCREFSTVFSRIFRPDVPAVPFQDAEWTEPHALVKIYHLTDLKAVFLSDKVEQPRSAVIANYPRIRQQSAVLKEVQQAALDIVKRINQHRVKLCREEVESIRQFQKMMRQEARRRDYANSRPTWIEERAMNQWRDNRWRDNRWRDNLTLPDFARPAVHQPVFQLLPQAPARQALEVENTPHAYRPVTTLLPASGTGFEVLFGCPQESLVPVSAPAPETDMADDDVVMLDAPDMTQETKDVSMVEVEMAAAEMANSEMDVDIVDVPYEPLLCQGSPIYPAPPLLFNPVSAAFEDTAMEVEQGEDLGMTMPVTVPRPPFILIHRPASPLPSIPPAAFAAPAEANAQVQPAGSGSRSSDSSLPPIDPRLFDAMVEQTVPTPEPEATLAPSQPQQQQVDFPVCAPIETSVPTPVTASLPAPAPSHSFAPATATEAINFAPQAPGPRKSRRSAKPRPRPRRIRAQAPAAALSNAPAPDPPQVPQLPAAPAPATAPQSSPLASDEGDGNASTNSPEAEPTKELDYAMIPGEIVRSHCEDWIEACAAFMETSNLCANLSPRWIRTWKQSTLINLGQELPEDVDEAEIDQDGATSLVRRFFQFNLLRWTVPSKTARMLS